MVSYSIQKICYRKHDYEIIPIDQFRLNFQHTRKNLPLNFELLSESPYFLLLAMKETEITLYPNGRMLIKRGISQEEAKAIAKQIFSSSIPN